MIINDLFCNFIGISDHEYECSKCGNKIFIQDNIEEPPLFPCSSPLSNGSAKDVLDFMSTHTSTDNLCSLSQIEQRHSVCLACEYYSNNSCNKCGCYLTKDRNYMNKLALKEESCPINKW